MTYFKDAQVSIPGEFIESVLVNAVEPCEISATNGGTIKIKEEFMAEVEPLIGQLHKNGWEIE